MERSFEQTIFRATHNSFTGKQRGSLAAQLESGVRQIELDVVDSAYRTHGYRVGHGIAGAEVENGNGNPDGDALRSWLEVVADWCARRPDHVPVTIYLDPKRDLTDPDSFVNGNLAALNELLVEVFGERLFRADALGDEPWPSLSDLAGRVLCVLSGNLSTRRGYLADGGREPAVSLDDSGAVVEVHSNRFGDPSDLWYWSGRHVGPGIAWRRHGRICPGRSPAISLLDETTAVLVYGSGDRLSCRLGGVDAASAEIAWSVAAAEIAPAAMWPSPTVRALGGGRVRVTYESGAGRMAQEGTLGEDRIGWEPAAPASAPDAEWTPAHARSAAGSVSVISVPHPRGGGAQQLRYSTDALTDAPVAYEQLMFVEGKWEPEDGDADVARGRRFVATAAHPSAAGRTRDWRDRGMVVRLWGFDAEDKEMRTPPNFPATDHPHADWYREFVAEHGAV